MSITQQMMDLSISTINTSSHREFMNVASISSLSIIGILIFLMLSDEMIASYVYLRINLALLNLRRLYLIIMLHPNNKLTKWWFFYRMSRDFKKYRQDD